MCNYYCLSKNTYTDVFFKEVECQYWKRNRKWAMLLKWLVRKYDLFSNEVEKSFKKRTGVKGEYLSVTSLKAVVTIQIIRKQYGE